MTIALLPVTTTCKLTPWSNTDNGTTSNQFTAVSSCANLGNYEDVWYRIQVNHHGAVSAITDNPTKDVHVSVWDGCYDGSSNFFGTSNEMAFSTVSAGATDTLEFDRVQDGHYLTEGVLGAFEQQLLGQGDVYNFFYNQTKITIEEFNKPEDDSVLELISNSVEELFPVHL
jgi:hypothetical protein